MGECDEGDRVECNEGLVGSVCGVSGECVGGVSRECVWS